MFYILASDGSRLGPVDAGTLRQWLLEGRVTGQTPVQPEGSGDWQALATLPEFAEGLRTKPAGGVPPPLPPSQPPPAPRPGTPPPSDRPRNRPRPSALAVASLGLAIISPCTVGLSALVGLVLGIVALVKIRRRQGQLTGKGLAVSGVVISALALILIPIALGFLLPALARMQGFQGGRRPDTCVVHLQNVALAMRLAAEANEGKFPPAASWCEAVVPNLQSPELLKCPSRTGLRCGFAYNRNIAGRTSSSVPPDTVLLIESGRGWNATAGPEDPLLAPPHNGVYSVAFADGSVREISPANLPTLRWEP